MSLTKNLYICYYAQEFAEFRFAELQSISEMFSFPVVYDEQLYCEGKPFLLLTLPDKDAAENILTRSVLMKSIVEVWGMGSTIEEMSLCYGNTMQQRANDLFKSTDASYKIDVDGYNKKMSLPEKIEWIEHIQEYVSIDGRLDLSSPDNILSLLLDFGAKDSTNPKCEMIYFGKLVGLSQRQMIHKYSLKSRHFIGNTSMDPQLSMLMANQALASEEMLIYDPFVGTGSVIVACAHFGAKTAGSDIDQTIIYGRGRSSRANVKGFRERDEVIRTNFQKYGLEHCYVDVAAADATRPPLRCGVQFDSIVTDPPYGIREGGRKSGSQGAHPDSSVSTPTPITQHALPDIMESLFKFANVYLTLGGRLVYWLPVHTPTYSEESIPCHPAFILISNSEQKLSAAISRRLITMKKITPTNLNQMASNEDTSVDGKNSIWKQQQKDFRNNYFKVDVLQSSKSPLEQ